MTPAGFIVIGLLFGCILVGLMFLAMEWFNGEHDLDYDRPPWVSWDSDDWDWD